MRLPRWAAVGAGHERGDRHRIDSLLANGGSRDEIRVLEGIAIEVHILKQRLADPAATADEDLPPRVRIAALTRRWTKFAPLAA